MCAAVPPSSVAAPRGKKARRRGTPRSNHKTTASAARITPPPVNGASTRRLDPPRQAAAGGLHARRSPPLAPTVCRASTGDHAAIGQVLSIVFPGSTGEAYLATLDDPFYEPPDRLLIKHNSQLVAHLRLTHRELIFGRQRWPVAGLFQLGTLPEFRGRGYAGRLLEAAHRQMAETGAELGLLSTDIPHFFRPAGWAVCGRHSHLRVAAQDLLAHLSQTERASKSDGAISVRPWRQVELPALMRLYAQHTRESFGPLHRGEAYWRWLLSRPGYDEIYVAIQGPDRLNLEEYGQDGSQSPLVGYAVTKDDRILELVTAPGNQDAAAKLLARAAREAIERYHHGVTLHAAPNDPLGQWLRAAGGVQHFHEAHQGEVLMAKVLQPINFLQSLCPLLHARADACRLPRPCELGLLLEGEKHRLIFSSRSVKLKSNKVGRSYLCLNGAEFTRLVLGHTDVAQATARGRMEASTRIALQTARAVFPQLPLWRPPWDDQLP